MRWLTLLLIAVITFAIVLAVKKPEYIKEFWLWLVGFAGFIIRILQIIKDFLVKTFSKISEEVKQKKQALIDARAKRSPNSS